MPSHRPERVAEAIREVVSSAILFDVADPRIQGVTVLRAEVSGDLRHATVYVSLMGSEAHREQAWQGLQHARGFLQSRVAARLQLRFAPVLAFKRDEGVKKSIEISRLIDQAIAADHRPEASSEPEVTASEDEDLLGHEEPERTESAEADESDDDRPTGRTLS